jgi:hypothetical protein
VTLYVVLILVAAWGWWGIANLRDRYRSVGRGSNSIAVFNDRLSVLERTGPAWEGLPAQVPGERGLTAPRNRWATGVSDRQRSATRQLRDVVTGTPLESVTQKVFPSGRTMKLSEAQARRRQIVGGLLAAVLVTGPLALLAGGLFVLLFVTMLVTAAAYLVLLVRARAEQIERAIKVRSLERRSGSEAAYGAVGYGVGSYAAVGDNRANEAWALRNDVAVGYGYGDATASYEHA